MMSSRRMNAAAGDDLPFAAMQPPPYIGFELAGMMSGSGGGGQRHQGPMIYNNFDFAAAAAAFNQFQGAPHHQMLALPPNGNGAGELVPMAPPPMPWMQLQMPRMAMHGHGDVYPALGIAKHEGGAGDAGRIGLNHGRHTYCPTGDMLAVDGMLMRSRQGSGFGLGFGRAHHQPPRCQVEYCKTDLSSAKHYHRRHKVCEYHAKASLVSAAGKQQRFCQQCSRFHVLTEFDEAKRSCRKRLAEHNRRRRKSAASGSGAAPTDLAWAPPSMKPNAEGISSSYAANNNTLSATKSTISSYTSATSCLQQDQARVAAARQMTLTLGVPPEEDRRQQQLSNAMQLHHQREQQHFITSLQHNNVHNSSLMSCPSMCSSTMPSAAVANGQVSDQNNDDTHGSNHTTSNSMHMFEVDFM